MVVFVGLFVSYFFSNESCFLESDYQVLGALIRKFCLNNFFSAKKLKKKLKLLFRATFGCLQGDVSSRVHNFQAAQVDPLSSHSQIIRTLFVSKCSEIRKKAYFYKNI